MVDEPIWLIEARKYVGLKEIKGQKHNQLIIDFWKSIKLSGIKNDEVPWCAAFVGAMLEHCNIKSTRKDSAKSYMDWGVPLDKPCIGAIVVFWRDSKDSGSGHVAIVTGKDNKGNITVIGGNQGDEVNEKSFPINRVLGYRWPAEIEIPMFCNLPITSVNLSTREV